MKIKENNTYKLLVEGNDDQRVVWALCKYHNSAENFDVIDCDGVEKLLAQIDLRLSNPESNQRIGIVVDADTDLQKRWETLVSKLKASGKYRCDAISLPETGLIIDPIDEMDPTIGIWIMPNNNLNGMLEDFVIDIANESDPLMKKAEQVLTEIEADETYKEQRYRNVHRSKAKIHTFLAWQDEPGKPMGQAITAHILNPDSPQAAIFATWLKQLFN